MYVYMLWKSWTGCYGWYGVQAENENRNLGLCRDLFLVIFLISLLILPTMEVDVGAVLCTPNKNGDVIAELCGTSLTCWRRQIYIHNTSFKKQFNPLLDATLLPENSHLLCNFCTGNTDNNNKSSFRFRPVSRSLCVCYFLNDVVVIIIQKYHIYRSTGTPKRYRIQDSQRNGPPIHHLRSYYGSLNLDSSVCTVDK